MAREVKVAILGDAKSLINALGLSNTAVGSFFTKLQAQSKLGTLALAAGFAGAAVVAGKALYDIGASFDDAYDKIRVGTGATGRELAGLEESFRKAFSAVPTTMDAASSAITVIHERLGLTGRPLERLAEQLLELSRITKTDLAENVDALTGAFNVFHIAVKDQPKILDELFRASQNTGASVASIAAQAAGAAPVMQALGFSFEQTAALAAILEKNGLSLSDVMMGFQRSLSTFAKAGESAPEAFKRFVDALKNAPDDIVASQLALDVLGARGVKFAQLVRSGAVDYETLLATIQGGNDTIRGAATETNDFAEKWTLFKNRVLVALEPVASEFFDAIGDGMDWVNAHWADFQRGFEDAGIVIQRLWTVAKPIYEAMIGQIIALLNLVDDLIHGRWGEIWDDFVGILKAAFNALVAPIRGVMALFDISMDDIKGAVSAGLDAVVAFLAALPGRALAALSALPGLLLDLGLRAMRAQFDGMTWVAGQMIGWAATVPGRVLDAMAAMPSILIGTGMAAISGLWNGMIWIAGEMLGWVSGIPGQIAGAVGDLGGLLWRAGRQVINGLLDGIKSAVEDVYDFVSGIAGKIASLKGPLERDRALLVPAGAAMMGGLLEGLQSGYRDVQGFIGTVAPSINGTVNVAAVPTAGAGTAGGNGGGGGPSTIVIPLVLDGRTITQVVVSNLNRAGGPKITQHAVV